MLAAVNRAAAGLPDRQPAVFSLHPAVVAAALLSALFTVLLSAWLPARRLCRIAPLEALRGNLRPEPGRFGKPSLTTRLLGRCFGIRGELAGNALRAQKKSLRIANASLLLSFLAFTSMLCFFTLSGISTRMTYFERYQDAWDVMASLPGHPPFGLFPHRFPGRPARRRGLRSLRKTAGERPAACRSPKPGASGSGRSGSSGRGVRLCHIRRLAGGCAPGDPGRFRFSPVL